MKGLSQIYCAHVHSITTFSNLIYNYTYCIDSVPTAYAFLKTILNITASPTLFSSILAIFHCACAVSTILHLPAKNLNLNSVQPFSYKYAVNSGRDTIFGNFCDNHVCVSAVRTLILLPVANLSLEIDSATLISYEMQTFCL